MDIHSGAAGVKYPHDTDIPVPFTPCIHDVAFRATFSIVIKTTDSNRVDITPVLFFLGVIEQITVDLRGGGLEKPGVVFPGQAHHVQCP